MKRDFKLFIDRPNSKKLITQYSMNSDVGFNNQFSTFDEKISFQEHDQITLTFSIAKYINSAVRGVSILQQNEILHLLHIGTKITLIEDGGTEYSFIVASIQPNLKKNNACYNFTCQDEVSYRWSRIKLGYSYSTIERGGPRSLYTIAQEILDDCYLSGWDVVVSNELSTALAPLSKQLITFEIIDSNPYNAIIEACNSANAQLSVNYGNKTITFYQKNNRPFSGYRYRPELNLSNLGATYSGDNLATILHVAGGTNEIGQNVTLVPYMPLLIQRYFLEDTEWFTDPTNSGRPWWYSDLFFPVYFQHVIENGNSYTADKVIPILDASSLQDDIGTDNMPSDFTYTDYDVYKNNILQAYPTVNEYNDYITGMQAKYADFYLSSRYTAQKITSVDELPSLAGGNLDEYNNLVLEQQQIELQEFKQFTEIANKQHHLGQFLLNFDFFRNSSLLSEEDHMTLLNKFNWDMRNNNIWLKIYTQNYQESIWILNQKLLDIRTYLEQANALYSTIYTNSLKTEEKGASIIAEYLDQANIHIAQANALITDDLFALLHSIYDGIDVNAIPEFQDLYSQYDAYKKIRDEAIAKRAGLMIQLESLEADVSSPEYISLKSELEYYNNRYLTAISLCGEDNTGYWTIYADDDKIYKVTSLYKFLEDNIISSYVPSDNEGVYAKLTYYEAENNKIWKDLYIDYGQYIYEQKYENTDELNSVNLYNQAAIYFEDYNKPSANYSVDVLDLGSLEPIALPRLKVGYCIRIYNDYLNLNDNELNNIQFTNNELIITTLSYDLRKPQKVSIGVEQVTQYQTILQKLIKTVK